jgi:predicted GNAT family N-acyltransferase
VSCKERSDNVSFIENNRRPKERRLHIDIAMKDNHIKIKFLSYEDGMKDAFQIREEVFIKEQSVPVSEEIDDIDKKATHIVIYRKENPIGTGRIFCSEGKWYIGRIAVIKDMRGKGIGNLIMEKLLSFAKKSGAKRVYLHSQTYIMDFYRKLGFSEWGEEFLDAGIPHMEMYKDL